MTVKCGNLTGYNLTEAGEKLGMHFSSVLRLCQSGVLKGIQKGSGKKKRWLITDAAIKTYLSENIRKVK